MMKKLSVSAAAFLAAASLCFPSGHTAEAATIDEVITESYKYGLFESNEKAMRYALESQNLSSWDLDIIIAELQTGEYDINKKIVEQIESGKITLPDSESNTENTGGNFSEMNDDEKKEFVQNLSDAEKKEIIKNMDMDAQLEIIDSIIGVGSELGINVSLESLTEDKLEYSIRDDNGQVIDISGMGDIVDNTGIDYTVLYLGAAGAVLVSSCGLAFMSKLNGSGKKSD